MGILTKAVVLLAAGAAGWALAKRKTKKEERLDDPHVVYLADEDAVIDPPEKDAEPDAVPAVVRSCFRRMDPLTLNGANEAVFLLEDGTEVKLNFSGEGGHYLKEGDRGLLTWKGMRLIRFEKENGDVIGGMFYAPAGECSDE